MRARITPDRRPVAEPFLHRGSGGLEQAGGRAGERGRALAGTPGRVNILTITAGSPMAAPILNSAPHWAQCSRSMPDRRIGNGTQPMRASAPCARSSAGTLSFCAGPARSQPAAGHWAQARRGCGSVAPRTTQAGQRRWGGWNFVDHRAMRAGCDAVSGPNRRRDLRMRRGIAN